VLGEQVLEAVLVEVLVGQLEDGLVGEAGEPDRRRANGRLIPFDGTEHPGRFQPGQLGGRRPVEVHARVGVLLEKARRDRRADRSLHRPGDHRGLLLAQRQQHDPAGPQNRAHAHRDGAAGNVCLAEEVAGGILSCHLVQRDQPGRAGAGRARLVEPDVSGPSDAEQLQVDAAGPREGPLVGVAKRADVIRPEGAVRDVNVGRVDVDVAEQELVHEAAVALQRRRLHGVVLVEVEGDDVGKGETLPAVKSDQLAVDGHRRRSRGQAQHALPPSLGAVTDELGDLAGQRGACRVGFFKDDGGDPLSPAQGSGGRVDSLIGLPRVVRRPDHGSGLGLGHDRNVRGTSAWRQDDRFRSGAEMATPAVAS
jgi:hypothetical protein